MMNKNVKIAKELVKLAKSLVAGQFDETVTAGQFDETVTAGQFDETVTAGDCGRFGSVVTAGAFDNGDIADAVEGLVNEFVEFTTDNIENINPRKPYEHTFTYDPIILKIKLELKREDGSMTFILDTNIAGNNKGFLGLKNKKLGHDVSKLIVKLNRDENGDNGDSIDEAYKKCAEWIMGIKDPMVEWINKSIAEVI